jgi:type IV pilus assembly protein PilV
MTLFLALLLLPPNMKADAGFTLIEVLVAVIILGGALLGLAALQAVTLRNNQSAYLRSQATQLAYDIGDRMRSNLAGVINGSYNNKSATTNDCILNSCTSTQMAGYDLAQWNTAISSLPNGIGVVCLDSSPITDACDNTGSSYTIKIWWIDDKKGTIARFVTSFQP